LRLAGKQQAKWWVVVEKAKGSDCCRAIQIPIENLITENVRSTSGFSFPFCILFFVFLAPLDFPCSCQIAKASGVYQPVSVCS